MFTLLLGGVGGNSANSPSNPLASPYAYYRFQDNLNDSSGNNRTLSVVSPVQYNTGIIGKGLTLGEVHNTGFNITTGAYSISCWLKVDNIVGDGGTVGVMLKDDQDTIILACEIYGNTDTNFARIYDTNSIIYSDELTAGWHYIAVTYTQITLIAYVDGIQLDNSPSISNGIIDLLYISTGDEDSYAPVDEVAIYDFALTASQIEELYNNGSGYDPTL